MNLTRQLLKAVVLEPLICNDQREGRIAALQGRSGTLCKAALEFLLDRRPVARIVQVAPNDHALPVHDRAERVDNGKHGEFDAAHLTKRAERPAPRAPSGKRPGLAARTAARPSALSG